MYSTSHCDLISPTMGTRLSNCYSNGLDELTDFRLRHIDRTALRDRNSTKRLYAGLLRFASNLSTETLALREMLEHASGQGQADRALDAC